MYHGCIILLNMFQLHASCCLFLVRNIFSAIFFSLLCIEFVVELDLELNRLLAGLQNVQMYRLVMLTAFKLSCLPDLFSSMFLTSCSKKASAAVRPLGRNGWVSRCKENFYCSSSEWLEKAAWASSHLLAGHSEEQSHVPQPECGRSLWAHTEQATMESIGDENCCRWLC